jgi:hypothetical protein
MLSNIRYINVKVFFGAAAVILFLLTSIGWAQTPVAKAQTLTGEWELDQSRMPKPNSIGTAILSRIKSFSNVLLIENNDKTITLKEIENVVYVDDLKKAPETKEFKRTFFMDGRGEINDIADGEKTKTRWIGKKLVITNYLYGEYVRKVEPVSYFEYFLSEDGKTLIKYLRIITKSKKEENDLRELDALEGSWYYSRKTSVEK